MQPLQLPKTAISQIKDRLQTVRNSRIEAAARALEQETASLLPFAGGSGINRSWKADLAADIAWPDLETKAQQMLFATGASPR